MLKGIMPVLLSPLHEDGSPDHEGFARLLDYIYRYPVPGLWVLGSAGEAFILPYRHRVEIARIVADHMKGRTHLIVGCGDPVLDEVFRFFDDTAHLPIQGYHCLPTDRKMNTSFTIDYYTTVADRSPHSLWLYSNPARAHQPTVEAVRVLSQHPNIVGMKVGGYDLSVIVPLAMLNSEKFQILGAGAGGNLLAYLALGVQCCTMSTASCLPKQCTEIYELWQQGRVAEATEKGMAMARMVSAFPPRRNTESTAEEKAVLELMGIGKRWVYPPFKPCTDEQVAQIRRVLVDNGILA